MKVICMKRVLSCATAIIFVISCKAAQVSENECGICEFPMDRGEIVFVHPRGGFAHKKCFDIIESALKEAYASLKENFSDESYGTHRYFHIAHCFIIKYVRAQIGPHTILGYMQMYGPQKLKTLIDNNTLSAIQLGLAERARLIKEEVQQHTASSSQ